jgi:hypothetical protein
MGNFKIHGDRGIEWALVCVMLVIRVGMVKGA